MTRCIFFLLVLCASYLAASPQARAGVFICNQTGATLHIAVHYKDHSDGNWKSAGWWRAAPAECAQPTPLTGPIYNRYFYYYASGLGGKIEFAGETYQCGARRKFGPSDCDEKLGYRRVDTGGDNSIYSTYTLNLTEKRNDPLAAARNCQNQLSVGKEAFAKCWMRGVASAKQRQILDCVNTAKSNSALALCASRGTLSADAQQAAECAEKYADHRNPTSFLTCTTKGKLSDENQQLLECAVRNRNSMSAAAICAAGTQLSDSQRRMIECIATHRSDYKAAGLCVAGTRLSPQQTKIASCVMSNRGSYAQMGVCAFGDDFKLTPEQQAFVECAMTSSGHPVAYAGCVGTRLTVNELEKCMTDGIGGDGCFGKNNTLIKTVDNAWKDVTRGPGPSNDLVGRDGAVMKAARDVEEAVSHAGRELEKSGQKIVENPVGAVEDFFDQLGCGFC